MKHQYELKLSPNHHLILTTTILTDILTANSSKTLFNSTISDNNFQDKHTYKIHLKAIESSITQNLIKDASTQLYIDNVI